MGTSTGSRCSHFHSLRVCQTTQHKCFDGFQASKHERALGTVIGVSPRPSRRVESVEVEPTLRPFSDDGMHLFISLRYGFFLRCNLRLISYAFLSYPLALHLFHILGKLCRRVSYLPLAFVGCLGFPFAHFASLSRAFFEICRSVRH